MNKKEDERKEYSKEGSGKRKISSTILQSRTVGEMENCRIILGLDSRLKY
jgi:hypothetical protein